jgi:hypothetical protein
MSIKFYQILEIIVYCPASSGEKPQRKKIEKRIRPERAPDLHGGSSLAKAAGGVTGGGAPR